MTHLKNTHRQTGWQFQHKNRWIYSRTHTLESGELNSLKHFSFLNSQFDAQSPILGTRFLHQKTQKTEHKTWKSYWKKMATDCTSAAPFLDIVWVCMCVQHKAATLRRQRLVWLKCGGEVQCSNVEQLLLLLCDCYDDTNTNVAARRCEGQVGCGFARGRIFRFRSRKTLFLSHPLSI